MIKPARRAWGIGQDPPYSGMPGGRVLPVLVGRVAAQYSRPSISDRVLAWRIDAQASWTRRWRRRANWYEDHDVARARLMISRIIGRNEVVLDLCRGPDIQTGRLSQRNEKRRPRIPRAG